MSGDALLFEKSDDGRSVVVRGNPDSLVGFLHRFQDGLWQGGEPDWREHESVAKQMERHVAEAKASGYTTVAIYDDLMRKAFVDAIR